MCKRTANIEEELANIDHVFLLTAFDSILEQYINFKDMKKLEKLNSKKVSSLDSIKGGRLALQSDFAIYDDQEKTTSNVASWNGQHWVTDVRQDPK